MRVLVGWDDPAEADLIGLYLNVDGWAATVRRDAAGLVAAAEAEPFAFDAVLLSTALPDGDSALAAFRRLRERRPGCPVVGVCRSEDVYALAAFLRGGMRTAVPRDTGGDFVFLLRATLEATLDAVRAEDAERAAAAMRAELDAVRQVQSAVLPASLPQPPGYRLAALCEPSRIRVTGGAAVTVAGGDYYDSVRPDANHTTLLLADATGHGLRSCLSIVAVDALLRTLPLPRFRDPAGLLSDLNRLFCRQRLNRFGNGFVTAVCVVLRHDRHQIHWSAAGHPVPLLAAGGAVAALPQRSSSGPPLGVDENIDFPTEQAALPAGSRLLAYTDGLSEAAKPDGPGRKSLFGTAGLSTALAESTGRPPEDALRHLFAAAERFAGDAGREDDSTALLLERVG